MLGGYFEMLESGRQDKLEESSFQVSLKSHDQDLAFCTSLLSLLLFKLVMKCCVVHFFDISINQGSYST